MKFYLCVLLVSVLAVSVYDVYGQGNVIYCEDERSDCAAIITANEFNQFAVDDYCRRWRHSAAIKQCKRTCGQCGFHQRLECRDEGDACPEIERIHNGVVSKIHDYCRTYSHIPRIARCKRTCGFC